LLSHGRRNYPLKRLIYLSTCEFWVQVHGLPLQNMTAVNAIKIGKKFIGEVLNVENRDKKGIIARHHLRIRIAVNILLPLHPEKVGQWMVGGK